MPELRIVLGPDSQVTLKNCVVRGGITIDAEPPAKPGQVEITGCLFLPLEDGPRSEGGIQVAPSGDDGPSCHVRDNAIK